MKKILALSLFTFLLLGCVIPKTAQEFRDVLPSSPFGHIDKFKVNISLESVTNILKKKTDECLNLTVTASGGVNYKVYYFSTIETSQQRTELALLQKYSGINPREEGNYYMVVDAIAAGKEKTEIHMYWASTMMPDGLEKAMKRWVGGNTKGCPDMTTTLQ